MSDAATQSIDLNHATERQLLGIDGIEPALIHALIEYRTHHGHFLSWEDVSRVPGLDAASLEQVQHACRIGGIES
jgi:competence ComEA-like helix-hairpin-helix protein